MHWVDNKRVQSAESCCQGHGSHSAGRAKSNAPPTFGLMAPRREHAPPTFSAVKWLYLSIVTKKTRLPVFVVKMWDNKTWQQTRNGGSCDALQLEAVRHRRRCASRSGHNAPAYQISAQSGNERLSFWWFNIFPARFQMALSEPLVLRVKWIKLHQICDDRTIIYAQKVSQIL